MTRSRDIARALALLIALIVVLAGCSPDTEAPADPGDADDGAAEPAGDADDADDGDAAAFEDLEIAVLFPGVITDADYNTLGYLAVQAFEEQGARVAFTEAIDVPDVQRVIREYIDEGFTTIWSHAGHFHDLTLELVDEFPDVNFITEFDDEPETIPDNVWIMDRNFHLPMYPLGAMAGNLTETGRIGYIGGPRLPFTYSEVTAMRQAISDLELDAEVVPVWVGDFNDPVAGQQVADQMLGQGIDVLVGSINLGMVGVFEAVTDAPAGEAWVTAKYTDKSTFAPDHYVTSVLYDFVGPVQDIVERIAAGERSGYYLLGFETGVDLHFPLQNVPAELNDLVQDITDQVRSGEIEVIKDTSPIE